MKKRLTRRWTVCRGCLDRMDAERHCLAYADTPQYKSKFIRITVQKAQRKETK